MSSPTDPLRLRMSSPVSHLRPDMSSSSSYLIPRGCEVCHWKDKLQLCEGCRAVHYCGPAHETSNRENHRTRCEAIRKKRERTNREANKMPRVIWEDCIGDFGRFPTAIQYVYASCSLVWNLLNHFGADSDGRVEAVEAALNQYLDMLYLCRRNLCMPDRIPALYMSLGRDQEAYDFIKIYSPHGPHQPSTWVDDIPPPFLEPKNADILEELVEEQWTDGKNHNLKHTMPLLLIKVRATLDLQAVQSATRALAHTLPSEIIGIICSHLVGDTLAQRPEVLRPNTDEITRLIRVVKAQVQEIYLAVDTYSHCMWRFMLYEPDPGPYGRYESLSSPDEARIEASEIITANRKSWCTTPGAMEMMVGLRQTCWCRIRNGLEGGRFGPGDPPD